MCAYQQQLPFQHFPSHLLEPPALDALLTLAPIFLPTTNRKLSASDLLLYQSTRHDLDFADDLEQPAP